MPSHRINRPALISVFADQRRTKSTIWSRVSCGTQTPVRVPQLFFLGQHALPSVQPKPHLSSGSCAPDRRFVPVQADGWCVPFVGKPPLRSRKTPSASGRTRLAGVPVRHTDPRSALLPPNAASEWQPSLPACSASVASSCVRSVILTDERFLHFQLRRDTDQHPETQLYDLREMAKQRRFEIVHEYNDVFPARNRNGQDSMRRWPMLDAENSMSFWSRLSTV